MNNKLTGSVVIILMGTIVNASVDNQMSIDLNVPMVAQEPINIVNVQEENRNNTQGKGDDMSEKINIGIAAKDRTASVTVLNNVLADEFVLLVQTLNYHWNLVGPEFHDYHLLFDAQYKAIFEIIDAVAERVRAVGGIALGSMADVLAKASLKEATNVPTPRVMVETLLAQHEALIVSLRDGINKTALNNNDMGTSNFLTDLMEKHEKTAWMLRSLLGR